MTSIKRSIRERAEKRIQFARTIVRFLYEDSYVFEVQDRVNRRTYIRNALWIVRQSLVNVCFDMIKAMSRFIRYNFRNIGEDVDVEATLGVVDSELSSLASSSPDRCSPKR